MIFASSGYLALLEHELEGTRPRHLGAYRDERAGGRAAIVHEDGAGNRRRQQLVAVLRQPRRRLQNARRHRSARTCVRGAARGMARAVRGRRLRRREPRGAAGQRRRETSMPRRSRAVAIGRRGSARWSIRSPPTRTSGMAGYHQKTRNMVRKAQRQGFVLRRGAGQALDFLHEVHTENMAAIGGRAKPSALLRGARRAPRRLMDDLHGEPRRRARGRRCSSCGSATAPSTTRRSREPPTGRRSR